MMKKRLKINLSVLRPLILGMVAGAAATTCAFLLHPRLLAKVVLSRKVQEMQTSPKRITQEEWLRRDFRKMPCRWCYMKIDANGWSVTPINNLLQLKERINTGERELVIPVFPTVYEPNPADTLYYNTVLHSDIKPGDKVLVVGAGSGSDAWVAWLKSQSPIYVIEINPMAVANIETTARLGNFPVKTLVGDIRNVALPEDFNNFDFVLWDMPYLLEDPTIEEWDFHDGDDGSILKGFLSRLPSLLKKDGRVIIMNTEAARPFIDFPNLTIEGTGGILVYIFSNKPG